MKTNDFKTIKDLAYLRLEDRLKKSPGMEEELIKNFSSWFQGILQGAKIQEMQESALQAQLNQ